MWLWIGVVVIIVVGLAEGIFGLALIKHWRKRRKVKRHHRVPALAERQGRILEYNFDMPSEEGRWGSFKVKRRRYIIYLPRSLNRLPEQQSHDEVYPLVCLFHGSHQSAYNSSLFLQPSGAQSWQELAEQERLILMFGESTSWKIPYNPKWIEALWLPGPDDLKYVKLTLEFICKDFPIDKQRIYAVGHSNGGLFMSDLAIAHGDKFAAICNHMGGLSAPRDSECKSPDIRSAKAKAPLFVLTSTAEDNRMPCHRARDTFREHGWDVEFLELKGVRHGYDEEKTPIIWEFLRKHRLAGGHEDGDDSEKEKQM